MTQPDKVFLPLVCSSSPSDEEPEAAGEDTESSWEENEAEDGSSLADPDYAPSVESELSVVDDSQKDDSEDLDWSDEDNSDEDTSDDEIVPTSRRMTRSSWAAVVPVHA